MNQTTSLLDTLKRALKGHGITYADVAIQLGLSENSIKRLFAEKSFSLKRLEQVCQLMQMEISDLMHQMEAASQHIDRLTEQQEQKIASDKNLLLTAICVMDKWTFEEIIDTYRISELECVQLLARLDRLKIIQLLPKNRVKLIISKNFQWRSNGPIQAFFQSTVQPDFFNSTFNQAGEKILFNNGMLSEDSNILMMKKLKRLMTEFNELHQSDVSLPLSERYGTGLVVALRAWEFKLFDELRREPGGKTFPQKTR